MRRFVLRPGVAVIPMGDSVQLRLGDEKIHVVTSDPPELARGLLERLAEGTCEIEDEELVRGLDERGWLVPEGVSSHEDDTARYLARFAAVGRDPARALDGAAVRLVGHAACVEVARSMSEGFSFGDGPSLCAWEAPDLALAFAENDGACAAKRPTLFVDLSHGTHATLGPFYVPGEGACYRCFRTRIHENTAAYAELVSAEARMLETREPLPGGGRLPAHRHAVIGLAMAEMVAFFTRHRPLRTLNRALTFDLEGITLTSEPVLRVPWCEACA